jgi:hypothetical protein
LAFLLKGPELLTTFGISVYNGLLLAAFAMYPPSLVFVLMWQRYALKVSFPPLKQAFLHPCNIFKIWAMKLFLGLEALFALLMYSNYGNSLAGLISVSIIFASTYGFVVVSEIGLHMAKDQRVWHPFRQEYGR